MEPERKEIQKKPIFYKHYCSLIMLMAVSLNFFIFTTAFSTTLLHISIVWLTLGVLLGLWTIRHPNWISKLMDNCNPCLIILLTGIIFSLSLWLSGAPIYYSTPIGDPSWLDFAIIFVLPFFCVALANSIAKFWRHELAFSILSVPSDFSKLKLGEQGYNDQLLLKPESVIAPIRDFFQMGKFESVILWSWVQIERTAIHIHKKTIPGELPNKIQIILENLGLDVILPSDRLLKSGKPANTDWLRKFRNKLAHGSGKAKYHDAVNALLILRAFVRKVNDLFQSMRSENS